jgi:hypothetical protein
MSKVRFTLIVIAGQALNDRILTHSLIYLRRNNE